MKCYLCSSDSILFMTKAGYHLYRCPSCGLVQTDLRKPYDTFIRDFYTDGYFLGDREKSAYTNYQKDKPYIQKNMSAVLSGVRRNKSHGNLLDVGCAYGFFVELARLAGFDAYGFDASEHAISQSPSQIRKYVRQGTISQVSYETHAFDVITMLDVFEHLGDPVSDLVRLRSLLKDDGIILIATGDTGSWAARVLRRRWTFYIPPQHLFFFNKKTMTSVLHKAGFTPISFFRVGKWLSLSYVLHLAHTSGESSIATRLQKIVDVLHIGSLPLYLPMGDNMVVIAKKY